MIVAVPNTREARQIAGYAEATASRSSMAGRLVLDRATRTNEVPPPIRLSPTNISTATSRQTREIGCTGSCAPSRKNSHGRPFRSRCGTVRSRRVHLRDAQHSDASSGRGPIGWSASVLSVAADTKPDPQPGTSSSTTREAGAFFAGSAPCPLLGGASAAKREGVRSVCKVHGTSRSPLLRPARGLAEAPPFPLAQLPWNRGRSNTVICPGGRDAVRNGGGGGASHFSAPTRPLAPPRTRRSLLR